MSLGDRSTVKVGSKIIGGQDALSWCGELGVEKLGQAMQIKISSITAVGEDWLIDGKIKDIDKAMLLNGRNLTNLGVFRTYIEEYLKAHPMTNDDLTMMCRQLEPTAQGIPIQIYTFSKDKELSLIHI